MWLSIWSNKAENATLPETDTAPDTEDTSTNSTSQNNTSNIHDEEKWFLTVYGLFGVGQTVTVVFAALLLYLSTLTGAKTLHNKMLSNILRNPLSFFDTTPQGRILNRCRCTGHNYGHAHQGLDYMPFSCNFNLFDH